MASSTTMPAFLLLLLLGALAPGFSFLIPPLGTAGSSMEVFSRRRESCAQGTPAIQQWRTSPVSLPATGAHFRGGTRWRTALGSSTRKVTAEELELEMTDWELPLILDVFATWCGPCLEMKPEINKVAQALDGKCRVLKMDADEEEAMTNTLKVHGLPTVLYMKDGQVKFRTEGAMPAQEVLRLADVHLFGAPSSEDLGSGQPEVSSACKPPDGAAVSEQ